MSETEKHLKEALLASPRLIANISLLHPKLIKRILPKAARLFRAAAAPAYPNLLKGAKITGLNQVWALDTTFIQLLHEQIYLAVILDLYSRKCIGWELSRNINSQLIMNIGLTNYSNSGTLPSVTK